MRVEKVNYVGTFFLVCDSVSITTTFTPEACHETFKIQGGYLN